MESGRLSWRTWFVAEYHWVLLRFASQGEATDGSHYGLQSPWGAWYLKSFHHSFRVRGRKWWRNWWGGCFFFGGLPLQRDATSWSPDKQEGELFWFFCNYSCKGDKHQREPSRSAGSCVWWKETVLPSHRQLPLPEASPVLSSWCVFLEVACVHTGMGYIQLTTCAHMYTHIHLSLFVIVVVAYFILFM